MATSPERVEAWTRALHDEWAADLRFSELRKGAQALSDVYVHRRERGKLARRAVDGRGKRAAFACYYGVVHALLVAELCGPGGPLALQSPLDVVDLGCGSGAVGVGLAVGGVPVQRVEGIDLVQDNLALARWSYRWWGLRSRVRRGRLPRVLPSGRSGELLALGWCVNELPADDRARLWRGLAAAIDRGAGLLLLAPLSRRAVPWWSEAERSLVPLGVESEELRAVIDRPQLVVDLDRATGLKHHEPGARVLFRPPAGGSAPTGTAGFGG